VLHPRDDVGALADASTARTAPVLSGDPPYPMNAIVFTVDPQGKDQNQRAITATRALRQTFQNPTTFDVGGIVVGIDVNNDTAVTAGLQVRIYQVDDVLANRAPGNLAKEFIFPTASAELVDSSTMRLGSTLTAAAMRLACSAN
jgi:hypothetical protein